MAAVLVFNFHVRSLRPFRKFNLRCSKVRVDGVIYDG